MFKELTKRGLHPRHLPRYIVTGILIYFVFQEVGMFTCAAITLLAITAEVHGLMHVMHVEGITIIQRSSQKQLDQIFRDANKHGQKIAAAYASYLKQATEAQFGPEQGQIPGADTELDDLFEQLNRELSPDDDEDDEDAEATT